MSSGAGRTVVDDAIELERRKLEEMLGSLESEAIERVLRTKEAARRELDELEREYSARAEGVRSRILGMAEIRARAEMLRLLDEESERVMKSAMERISSMPRDSNYERIIELLLEEAAAAVGSAELVVRPAKPDVAVAKRAISRLSRTKRFKGISMALSEEAVDSIGGVVVSSADGRVSYDNTFEARLERSRENIKAAILGELRR